MKKKTDIKLLHIFVILSNSFQLKIIYWVLKLKKIFELKQEQYRNCNINLRL